MRRGKQSLAHDGKGNLGCGDKLEGNGPVESAGDRALKINAGLLVGVGDISLTAVDQVSNLRRPYPPYPFVPGG